MHAALDTLEGEGIPLPSLVLFSGRGLLLLWLHSPLPARRSGAGTPCRTVCSRF